MVPEPVRFFGCPAMSPYPSLALVSVFSYNRFLQGKTGRRMQKIGRGGGAAASGLLPRSYLLSCGDVLEF